MTNIISNVTKQYALSEELCENFTEYSNEKGELPTEKRLRKLSAHKQRTVDFAEYLRKEGKIDVNFYNRLSSCYDYLLFKNYYNLDKVRLGSTHSCQLHLLCPMCAIVRAAKQVQLYESKYHELKNKNSKVSLYYVVLTVVNGSDLSERFNHLQDSLQKLISRRREAIKATNGKKSSNYALKSSFASVIAGAYSIEIKRGKGSKEWHPHVNLLLMSEDVISKKKLSSEWSKITKDSKITYCEVKPDDDKTVFVEIFKYALKFSDMEFKDNFDVWNILKGHRLMGSFGLFRGLDVPKNDTEILLKDEPYIEMFYKYSESNKKYVPNTRH